MKNRLTDTTDCSTLSADAVGNNPVQFLPRDSYPTDIARHVLWPNVRPFDIRQRPVWFQHTWTRIEPVYPRHNLHFVLGESNDLWIFFSKLR